MKYLKNLFFLIFSPILFLFLLFAYVETQTNKALKDYSMLPNGVEVVNKVILGRRERTLSKGLRRAYILEFGSGNKGIFRRGAISLICTNEKNVVLFVQDYKPTRHGKAGGVGKGLFTGSNTTASKYGKVDISNMRYLYRGYFDIYFSDPLSKREIKSMLEILEMENISRIGINAFDGGDVFSRNFAFSDVKQLTDNCQ